MARKFKIIVFDMDDTLFDTWGSCYPAAAREACEAMVDAGLNCNTTECIRTCEEFFRKMPKRDVFQHIVARHGIRNTNRTAEEVAAIGKTAFHSRQVEKDIKLFPGVRELLAELGANYMLFLVTSGDPKTQKQKVDLLRIKDYFTHIYYVNTILKQRKSQAFIEILERTATRPSEILCIGDRRDREIAEGKRLGFITCLVAREHQLCIRPEFPEEEADFEIESLSELTGKCSL